MSLHWPWALTALLAFPLLLGFRWWMVALLNPGTEFRMKSVPEFSLVSHPALQATSGAALELDHRELFTVAALRAILLGDSQTPEPYALRSRHLH